MCVQNLSCLAARVSGAGTDVTDSPVQDRNCHPIENFPGIDIDEFAPGYDEIGFHLSHRTLNQAPQFRLRSHYIPFVTQRHLGYQSCVGIKITNEPGLAVPAEGHLDDMPDSIDILGGFCTNCAHQPVEAPVTGKLILLKFFVKPTA
jgi:hypothetical protein